ncbi:MAG TPA: lipid A deacylase LpxR family protein [Prosthecobacter sp.]|nr:lipid A deacylase LpxR family protein [Prosthecobacter sp.]
MPSGLFRFHHKTLCPLITIKSFIINHLTLWGLAICLLAPSVRGAGTDNAGGTLGLYFENDLFAGTDRYYTSGAKLSWSSRDLEQISDSPHASVFLPLFGLLPFIDDKEHQKNLVFALGQNIYTPDNTEAIGPVPNDRPYAGWLYMGLGVVWKDASARNSLVLDIGVVGPWSYAQETQRLVHDMRDLDHPKGWDNQLHNELGFMAVYERMWRWPKHARRSGFDWEILPHAGAALGNVQTYANLGAELRFGLNLPDDFGTASIGPAATTSTPVDGWQGADRSWFDLGFYGFARADGRAVGRNIFLDGNTFGNSPSVGHNPFVADISVGVAMNIKNTKIAYALVYRTKEYRAQQEAQVFGTVSVNWTF